VVQAATELLQRILHVMIDADHQLRYSLHMRRFTPGELSVMRLLWEHGALKPSEIQKRYPSPIKNSALRSYLKILMEKGHVSRRKVGKAYEYQAVTRRRSAFRSMLRDLIDNYCEGSSRALIVNLIRTEKLSDEELVHLKRLADET
jgi:BlaI family transcriptional regulator, penicillinase repressor